VRKSHLSKRGEDLSIRKNRLTVGKGQATEGQSRNRRRKKKRPQSHRGKNTSYINEKINLLLLKKREGCAFKTKRVVVFQHGQINLTRKEIEI